MSAKQSPSSWMRPVFAVASREFRQWFATPIGYVYLVFFIAIANGLFFVLNRFFDIGIVSMRSWFGLLPWINLFFVPAFSMGLWSEEKNRGTLETLLTLPLSESQAALGKYLAGLGFLLIALLSTLTVPWTLSRIGDLDGGATFASYVGAFLLGASYLAVGQFLSALVRNQVVAFIVSVAALFALILIGHPQVVQMASEHFAGTPWFSSLMFWLSWAGLLTHFNNIGRGVLDSRDVIYAGIVTMFFLGANVYVLKFRRWQ